MAGDLSIFIAGLILVPLGIYLRRLRLRKEEASEPIFPPLTMSSPELRKLLTFVLVTTFANVVIAGQLTYSSINYMDTSRFCGQVCHTVMQPEYRGPWQSPHARVECVECHIGPGASSFVKAKINGMGQLVAVATNSYPGPYRLRSRTSARPAKPVRSAIGRSASPATKWWCKPSTRRMSTTPPPPPCCW